MDIQAQTHVYTVEDINQILFPDTGLVELPDLTDVDYEKKN